MAIILFLFLSLLTLNSHAEENNTRDLEKVTLQLDWKYQFEFAGFIMAKEKGFYTEAGLDVDMLEYVSGVDIIDSVLSQQVNYGLHNSSIVVENKKIKPIIIMATYAQRSPLVFIGSKDIKEPKDLIGKKIMGTESELKNSSLGLMLNHFSINEKNTQFVDHSFNSNDFIQHKVDVMTAFKTNEVFELEQQGVDYNIIDPAEHGFVMNAVNIFTSFPEALDHSDRTRRFIDASNKGWAYALANVDETVALIQRDYAEDKSIDALRFEAKEMKKLMLLDFFKIGEVNGELTQRLVKQMKYSGMIDSAEKLDHFLFEDVVKEFTRGVHFTQEQKQYLRDKQEINLCVDPDWMPFESIKDGKHIGITADIIHSFALKLPIPITLVKTVDWQDTLYKGQQRRCDIFSLASKTPKRQQYMDFTTSYIDSPTVMITSMKPFFIDDLAKIKDKKIGVVSGYSVTGILKKRYPDINIIDVETVSEGLKKVEKGELYGYIDNLLVVANLIQKEYVGSLKVSAHLDEVVKLSIATRNDEPHLHKIFEMLVRDMSAVELQTAYNNWVSVSQDPQFDYRWLWLFALIIIVLSIIYYYYYYRLKQSNDELESLSTTDKLTGLYNRLKLDDILNQSQSGVERYGIETCVILVDIDHFKRVNDRYGHLKGDSVLTEFAYILNHSVRVTDFVGRWGGEEFLIICPNVGIAGAVKITEKLLLSIESHTFEGVGSLTASAGVGQLVSGVAIDDSLENIDKALYVAKENGRNQLHSV